MLIMNSNSFERRTTSAMRSVPLACFGEVSATSAPHSKAALAIRMSSVAMITESNFLARWHRSQTWRRSGLPAIRYNGFPWKRVDPQRAGIIPTALVICKIGDYLRGCDEIRGNPIRDRVSRVGLKSGLNTNCPHPSVATALGVDLFIANKKRTREIDLVLSAGLQDHSRCRLAAVGVLTGNIGTEIGRIN